MAKKYNDPIWAYLAQGMALLSGLLLLPLIAWKLSAGELVLWLAFIAFQSLILLIDFGFQPTVSRNVAYVFSGQSQLLATGISKERNNNQISIALFSALFYATKLLYSRLLLISALFVILIATPYLIFIINRHELDLGLIFAWLFFALGAMGNLYFNYGIGIMNGSGRVAKANRSVFLGRLSFLVCASSALLMDYGLVAVGVSLILGTIISRTVLFFEVLRIPEIKSLATATRDRDNEIKMRSVLWHNAWRQGLVQLMGFILQRGNILIAAAYLSASDAASYNLTVTVLVTLIALSTLYANIRIPRMASLQAADRRHEIKRIYLLAFLIAMLFFTLGFVAFVTTVPWILDAVSADVTLDLPGEMFALLFIIFILEVNHVVASIYITSKNKIPFVRSSIISACAALILSMFSVHFYGLWGLIISQGIVQLAYNNWRWPQIAILDLWGRPDVAAPAEERSKLLEERQA